MKLIASGVARPRARWRGHPLQPLLNDVVRRGPCDYALVRLVQGDALVCVAAATRPGIPVGPLLITMQRDTPLTSDTFSTRAFFGDVVQRFDPLAAAPRVAAMLPPEIPTLVGSLYPIRDGAEPLGTLGLVTGTPALIPHRAERDRIAAAVIDVVVAWLRAQREGVDIAEVG